MARKNNSPTEVTFQRWIKDGRGSGNGRDYKPWLTVRDVASQGRSHRVFGHKSQRTHHLFSDLELAVFLILDWQPDILDIREQFCLQREITLELAEAYNIRHPAIGNVVQFMTSDFLVNSSRSGKTKFALQAKYSGDLERNRVIEKLELERRYWQRKDVPWALITEKEIPSTVFQNINWLYPAQAEEIPEADLAQRINFYSHHLSKSNDTTLIDLAKSLDVSYDLPAGQSLREMRQLFAQRFFTFNIHTPFQKLTPAGVVQTDATAIRETLHVQNK
ncbi:TnsA endonuclease N-terminal domain-containing protein [Pseudodesulfovibrio senegalensis]|uniref:Heteromeric transposase endonuclease subunit TnsA n=1 Tax=Pseudodesulfovibrio senegalensis TaxID=1721087 RepID=A0A6N6N5X0_9BACT|nr:TnsA endonuclease C-terminal domain-containing protein [Pseudodesulfovibrio senegalensis]KAB1442885.1 heteromeric transposase endonuclease subunit TnsA [Pseudodesulfovibrio senegalensis]